MDLLHKFDSQTARSSRYEKKEVSPKFVYIPLQQLRLINLFLSEIQQPHNDDYYRVICIRKRKKHDNVQTSRGSV